jgi:hypothetical protein
MYFVPNTGTLNKSREDFLGSVTYCHHCSYKNDIQTCRDSYVFCNLTAFNINKFNINITMFRLIQSINIKILTTKLS